MTRKHTDDPNGLTLSERKVVDALLRGLRPAEIAKTLCISRHTVRNHLKSVNRKLGVHSQVELIAHMHGMDKATPMEHAAEFLERMAGAAKATLEEA